MMIMETITMALIVMPLGIFLRAALFMKSMPGRRTFPCSTAKTRGPLVTRARCQVPAMVMAGLFLCGCSGQPEPDTIDVGQALAAPDAPPCFERADRERAILFPADLGPHDTFQTEWWYYTGNVKDEAGRPFGYQLTFFRRALDCALPDGDSAWRTRQLYFAHFAVTDITDNTFYQASRMNRQSLGIAGATSTPFQVWIDNWRAEGAQGQVHLSAEGPGFAIDLDLERMKPPVLQGRGGLSRKSQHPGNASYYYSFTRSQTRGTIKTAAGSFSVTGHSWFDHEWSTSALAADEKGWDWFALHLDDGRDLMVCQIRKADNRPNGFSFGCICHADGRCEILGPADFSLRVTEHWKSPATGIRYPSGWEVALATHALVLTLTPAIKHQEHTGDFVYWEGAVTVSGNAPAGKTLSGAGYVELTGYTKNR